MYMCAHLNEEQVKTLKAYEERFGVKLLAMSEVEFCAAPLDAAQLLEIHELEEELGACLVAIN
jgi:hypothetical protein